MSTEPLDPTRLAEIRLRIIRDLLAEVDRLVDALASERARVQRVEAVRAKSWRALSPVQIYTDVVSDWELGIALAGDTEGNG